MDRFLGQLGTDVYGITADEARVARIVFSAAQTVAADDDGVHAAITGLTTGEKTVTTDIQDMPACRNVTVKAGGTAGDIAAGTVTVYGKDMAGNDISEDFTITADTAATVTGDKAFAKVKKIVIPAQDGSGATYKIGFGNKLGLPYKLDEATEISAVYNGTLETTKPTLAIDKDNLCNNTVTLNTTLAGHKASVFLTL